MNGFDPVALDRHITGNYGEDFLRDEQELEDPETCSWCTTEVEDSALKETDDGERICPVCWSDYENRTNPDQPEGDPDE